MNCSVPECERAVRSSNAVHCEKHYYRLRRTGSTDDPVVRPVGSTYTEKSGYVMVKLPKGHREAFSNGWGRLHRVILFDAIGYKDHECHHCGGMVEFSSLHVDHLNADKSDNRRDNLAPSCAKCNLHRPMAKKAKMEKVRRCIQHQGRMITTTEAALITGVSPTTIQRRVKLGWSDERIMSPSSGTGPKATNRRTGRLEFQGYL